MSDFVSPYLDLPLRTLEQAKRDIAAQRLQSDLAEAIEDLDPIEPPKAPVYMLMIPGLVLLGMSVGAQVALAFV